MSRAALPPLNDRSLAAVPAPDLDPLLAPRPEGYLGADVALSIPLPDGRIFWIFGDTLVGRLERERRVVKGMPRNSVAIQPGPSADPASVELIYAGPDGEPRTFFQLPPSEALDKWFWATAGVVLDGELFVFGYSVTSGEGECEALSFRTLDTWLMRVRDIAGHPAAWRIEPARLPFPERGPWFASSAIRLDEYIYLMGMRHAGDTAAHRFEAVLARVTAKTLLSKGAAANFEFWSDADGGQGQWSSTPAHLAPLFTPGVSECTVLWDAPRNRFVATTYHSRRGEYMIAAAPALTGPWSPPVTVFRAEAHTPREAFLYYAFRLHPHLGDGPDVVAATYIVNPRQTAPLEHDVTIYYPRFLRLDLSQVG